ncbi:hypothetical protein D3C78_1980620 [compost metagenome]
MVGALDAGWRAIWFNHRGAKPESGHQPHSEIQNFSELKAAIEAQIGVAELQTTGLQTDK